MTKEPYDPTCFIRGQIEWALSRAFLHEGTPDGARFKEQVKHLKSELRVELPKISNFRGECSLLMGGDFYD